MPKAIPLNARGNYCRKVYESKIHLYDLPAAAFHLKAEVSDVVSAARKTDSLRCKSCHFTGKLFGNQTCGLLEKVCPSKFLFTRSSSCIWVSARPSRVCIRGAVGTKRRKVELLLQLVTAAIKAGSVTETAALSLSRHRSGWPWLQATSTDFTLPVRAVLRLGAEVRPMWFCLFQRYCVPPQQLVQSHRSC